MRPMRRGTIVALVTAGWVAGVACSDDGPRPTLVVGGSPDGATTDAAAWALDSGPTAPPERTLFVGNSFTFVNDLPGTYLGLATPIAPARVAPVVDSVAYGGYTLTQHLADARGTGSNPRLATVLGIGDAGAAKWNHVLLQEQSQIPGFEVTETERIASMTSTVSLSGYVAATGATSVLLMTWGYAKGDPNNAPLFPDFPTMQSLVETGYRQMAHAIAVEGHAVKVAPAGLAFRSIFEREVSLGHDPLAAGSLFMQLYGPDLIHPGVPGTYVAACVVMATIYDVDPTTLTADVAGIDASTKLVLQTAARDVVAAEKARPPGPTISFSLTRGNTLSNYVIGAQTLQSNNIK